MAKPAPHPQLELYTRFDDAAAREAKKPAPTDFGRCERRLRDLIDLLPQRTVIEDSHVERWLNRTIRMSIERVELEKGEGNAEVGDVHEHALWHVRRASAIGGSEMGTIVKHFRGDRGNFTSARNLALEKLLIMAPQRSTPEMARGNRAEPWIQRIYQEQEGLVTDEESLDTLKGYRWDRLPQIVGTPDDYVMRAGEETPWRKIADYKAPSADVCKEYEDKGVSFDYVCQVHHYSILAQARGLAVDEMEIAALDPRYFVIQHYEVERDPELLREIMQSARTFWDDFVMEGRVPDDIAPDDLDIQDEQIHELGVQASIMKVLSDEVETRQKELIERISMMGSDWHELATGKLELGVASLSRARKWDEDALRELAEASGIDPESYYEDDKKLDDKKALALLTDLNEAVRNGEDTARLLEDLVEQGVPMKQKFDGDRLAADLEAAGVNPTPAAGLQETFRLSQKKKGDDADKVRRVRAQVIELADMLENVVETEGQNILNGVETEEEMQP